MGPLFVYMEVQGRICYNMYHLMDATSCGEGGFAVKGWAKAFSCVLMGAAMLVLSGCLTKTDGYIDFSQGQAAPTAASVKNSEGGASLRIAFASVISPRATRQAYQTLVDYLAGNMDRPAALLQRRTYEDLNMLLANGDVDVAFLSTGAYAAYHGMTPVEILAMAQTDGSVLYHAYIIVPRDSGIKDFEDLRGKTFAFTDPLSYSGRLAIDFLLQDQQRTADSYFKRWFYTYNHDKSLWAVANHLADGASVDSQIYDYTARVNPQLTQNVRIIGVLPDAPTGPVVIRSDLPEAEKERLRQLFYQMDQDGATREALHQVMIDSFVPPQPELYEGLREKYDIRK